MGQAPEATPVGRWRIGAAAALAVLVAGGGAGAALIGTSHPRPTAGHHKLRLAADHHVTPPAPTSTTVPPAVVVDSVSPAPGTKSVGFTAPLTVRFSTPISASSPRPTLSPAVPGTWSRPSPRVWRFTPAGDYPPLERVAVTVPGGTAGVVGRDGATLSASYRFAFTVADPSTARLQQLLAELGYLPVQFVPASAAGAAPSRSASPEPGSITPGSSGKGTGSSTGAGTTPGTGTRAGLTSALLHRGTSAAASTTAAATSGLSSEANLPGTVALEARPGRFAWRFPNIPAQLAAQWTPGVWNVVTQGAVMAFEYANGLGVDGLAGPKVWSTLLSAVAKRQATTSPYDYLLVTETDPETLYVWRDGKVVYQSLANTGVPGAATALGTFPVYLRYTVTTMSGTNPDGSHYVDPGIPWVSYFNGGDAVHGFIRPGYGYPQSDGCVELPIANAAIVYPMDNYGTLVTVTTGDLGPELGVSTPPAAAPPAPAPAPAAAPPAAPPVTHAAKTGAAQAAKAAKAARAAKAAAAAAARSRGTAVRPAG